MDESSIKQNVASAQSNKSIKRILFGCFPTLGRKQQSDSELDSDNDYVILSHSVFKVPKENIDNNKDVGVGSCLIEENSVFENASSGSGAEHVVERFESERRSRRSRQVPVRRVSHHERKYVIKRKTVEPAKKYAVYDPRKQKIYDYIRRKTYERVNPYRMSPNDFLNNISSIFVENLKEPVPKDPFCRPRVYNRTTSQTRKKAKMFRKNASDSRTLFPKKVNTQKNHVTSDEIKNTNKGKEGSTKTSRRNYAGRTTQTRLSLTDQGKGYSYKDAIERQGPPKEKNEKVLIWKIIVQDDARNN